MILRTPHQPYQANFVYSLAKRQIVKAGRRGGKTVGIATRHALRFAAGRRQLYTTPTSEQLTAFWYEICKALKEPIDAGVLYKNETEHVIEQPGTKVRIRGKTAWNADTLRGDYGDDITFDEYQLMNESVWTEVGEPMLLDNDGDAVFIYTPPSRLTTGFSKARDPLHASKLWKKAQADTTGTWETHHFTSWDNPYISREALVRLVEQGSMSPDAYRREIMAEDDDEETSWYVYNQFNSDTCIIPRFDIPKRYPRYVGHDFGTSNPAALFVAHNTDTGEYIVYDEYLPGGGRSPADHVREWKRMTEGLTVVGRAGGSHQEEEVREAYRAHGWGIAEPTIPHVGAGIERVRDIMKNNKLLIFSNLLFTIGEINSYLWKVAPDGSLTNEIRDKHKFHLMDSLRYVCTFFRPEPVEVIDYSNVWSW